MRGQRCLARGGPAHLLHPMIQMHDEDLVDINWVRVGGKVEVKGRGFE